MMQKGAYKIAFLPLTGMDRNIQILKAGRVDNPQRYFRMANQIQIENWIS